MILIVKMSKRETQEIFLWPIQVIVNSRVLNYKPLCKYIFTKDKSMNMHLIYIVSWIAVDVLKYQGIQFCSI